MNASQDLRRDRVQVWQIDLQLDPERQACAWHDLEPGEQDRAGRFVFADDRRRYIAAHAGLRRLLGPALGLAPAQVRFTANPYGKPGVAGDLQFNLTHSGELALVALTVGRPVGVDLERLRPLDDLALLARQVFTPGERQELEQAGPGQALQAFFNGWTRKEALVKAVGEGLSLPLQDFQVALLPGRPAHLRTWPRPAPPTWRLAALVAPPGYAAALAFGLEGAAEEVQVQQLAYPWS